MCFFFIIALTARDWRSYFQCHGIFRENTNQISTHHLPQCLQDGVALPHTALALPYGGDVCLPAQQIFITLLILSICCHDLMYCCAFSPILLVCQQWGSSFYLVQCDCSIDVSCNFIILFTTYYLGMQKFLLCQQLPQQQFCFCSYSSAKNMYNKKRVAVVL